LLCEDLSRLASRGRGAGEDSRPDGAGELAELGRRHRGHPGVGLAPGERPLAGTALAHIADIILNVNADAYLIEAANSRREHE
jgi:hypothetical protein